MNKRYARIGLIGDIHAEDALLEQALDVLRSRGVELVAATGDVTDGLGSVERCCELLEAHEVVVVGGNHDRWFLAGTARGLPAATPPEAVSLAARRTLEGFPLMVELETCAGRALLCHGLGPNDMAKVNPDDDGYAIDSNDDLQNLLRGGGYRWILNGHSHRWMVRHFGGVTVINAGTLKRDHDPCFLELDFTARTGSLFSFDANLKVAADVRALALDGLARTS